MTKTENFMRIGAKYILPAAYVAGLIGAQFVNPVDRNPLPDFMMQGRGLGASQRKNVSLRELDLHLMPTMRVA